MLNKIYNHLMHSIAQTRALFWGLFLRKMGRNVDIMERVKIMSPQKVEIGNNVLLNSDVKIGGQMGVKIGNYVLVGYNVNIVSENHQYLDLNLPIMKQGFFGGPIVIEDDVWIGANVVILPNITIGKGSVIGANAVVTKNVMPYTIVGGIPAKFIKNRANKS